ncbi:MAG: UDP-N-acetylmuramoyl-tripeptide--D-alanyl-D-alanine ligase [Ilumatobacteraceae bacterium]
MRFRATDVAAATGGRVVGADVEIDGTGFDTRTLLPGQLFVPLIDQRDGHDFIAHAVERGAVAYLTSRGGPHVAGATAIEVDDTLDALLRLAADRRRRSSARVVGITGSVGKTSTKDFARVALAASHVTWANERSFNNDQGLPTTILNAPDDTQVMVLEMGMRGFGEIARLCAVAVPHIGVVTRVAEAHGDRVGGIDGVARAKAELVESLPADGTAILNADDPRVRSMASAFRGDAVTFGESSDADVRIVDVTVDERACASFTVATPWGTARVRLAVAGRHMAHNAAASLAAVGVVGGDLETAAGALSEVRLSAMRMEVQRTERGAIVLNDSYNANPTSMRAALDALADLPARRRVAIVGVMAEIADAEREHRAIRDYASARDIVLISAGTHLYGDEPVDDPVAHAGELGEGDAVLVKGSRVAGLEHVAAQLLTTRAVR